MEVGRYTFGSTSSSPPVAGFDLEEENEALERGT